MIKPLWIIGVEENIAEYKTVTQLIVDLVKPVTLLHRACFFSNEVFCWDFEGRLVECSKNINSIDA